MKISKLILTILNYLSSSFLCFLGLLIILFNALGLWSLWHLAGFAFIFFAPVPLLFLIPAVVISIITKDVKSIIINCITIIILILSILVTVIFSANWFW